MLLDTFVRFLIRTSGGVMAKVHPQPAPLPNEILTVPAGTC